MPEKKTMARAKKAKREGKSPSTQAGAFVREEIDHVREGKHGAQSTKQAIAIGLSKARRAGVPLRAPKKGTTSSATRTKAKRDLAKGSSAKKKSTAARRPSSTARAGAAGRRRKRGASTRRTKTRAAA
jgi:hypothetical protein